MNNRVVAVVAGIALLAGGAVLGSALDEDPILVEPMAVSTEARVQAPASTAEVPDLRTGPETPSVISRREAEERAVDEVNGGTALRAELEVDDASLQYWEVHVEQGPTHFEVDIARADGDVLDVEVADDDEFEPGRSSADPAVTHQQARTIALEETGGGDVRLAHLDSEDADYEWEVVVVDQAGRWIELTIDAASGDVLDVDIEDDRD